LLFNLCFVFFQVVYFSDKHADKPETIASKKLLNLAGVVFRQFVPTNKKIVIDFDVINS
jgi:dCMP deaminase